MASFNLNGLVNSFMPNIYINKVTLEGASGALNKIAANKEAAIDAHIDKKSPGEEGWTSDPTADDFTQSNKLVVTYNLLLETQDLFDEIGDFVDDIFKFLKVHLITFKNEKGKAAYQHYISKKNFEKFGNITIGGTLPYLDSTKDPSGEAQWPAFYKTQLKNNEDFKYTSRALDNIVENSMGTSAVNQLGLQNKRDFIKEKYKHTLPDGRVIYKIPVQIKQEIAGTAFPSDLAAIAICRLDTSALIGELEDATGADFEYWEEKFGRIASSVVIKNSLVPKQGMAFFVSTDQNSDKYDDLMGTLWFGGVHKHNDKYMAGNVHDPAVDHPYLDYVLVDNQSVQDFRQIAQIKKQIFNFETNKNFVFGGNYINNQLNQVATADFSNLACFGDLISSINTKRQAKLLFSIDWGKIIKKHCAVPATLDLLSNVGNGGFVTQFLTENGAPSIKSLKVYRKRVDVPRANDSVNDTVRKLVYEGYPNIYYTGQLGNVDLAQKQPIIKYNPKVKSALSPLTLEIPTPYTNSSHISYYTFTDYDIQNISKGSFEYSLEVEIEDPTLNYFISSYVKINFAISQIKPMVSFVNGGHNPLESSFGQNQLFNSQTGQFTQLAKAIFNSEGWGQIIASDAISNGIKAVIDFSMLAHNKPIGNAEGFTSLLSVTSGTPESFNVFSEILILVADKIKSVIDSYSTAPMPKTLVFGDDVGFEKVLGQVVSTAAQRTIKVEHFFKKPTEIVSTTHGDAGYEFLASTLKSPLPNKTTAEIGLKAMLSSDYINRSLNEFNQYFPNFNAGPLVLPVKIPSYNGPKSDQKLNLNLMPSVGMHLKVPQGATQLPRYIVDHESNNENEYWMVINNILRYKLGLYGDTNSNNKLGYGPDDVIDSHTGIDAQMERILKEYQTLAYKGIYFPQASVVDQKIPHEPAASKKELIGDVDGAPGGTIPWDNAKNNPLPEGVPFETNLEGTAGMEQLIKTMQVPWAQNYGQEKLLLALINGTFIAPTVLDAKLGSFDPMLVNSMLYKYVNNIYNNAFIKHNTPQGAMGNSHSVALGLTTAVLQELPYQALVLAANLNTESAVSLIHPAGTEPNPDFRYWISGGTPQVYEKPEKENSWPAVQNQDLKIDKFGQFWFNHMNVVEVQYLAGYEGIKNIPKPISNPNADKKLYEEVFNAALNAPIWEPLTVSKLNAMSVSIDQAAGPKAGVHLLCRLVKKRCDIFNTKAYDVLDMPLYDEYFLLTTESQLEKLTENAYITNWPDKTTSAGTPGLQMEDVGNTNLSPIANTPGGATGMTQLDDPDLDFNL